MKKFSLKTLLNKDLKIVERKKIFFIIPAAILLAAVIFMAIYGGIFGSPLNLGMDFTGGYAIQIDAGTKINDENYEEYEDKVNELIDNYVYHGENDTQYKIDLNRIIRLGTSVDTSMRIEFRAPKNIDKNQVDTLFEELIPDLLENINNLVAFLTPTISESGGTYTASYSNPIKNYYDSKSIQGLFSRNNISLTSHSLNEDNHSFSFTVSGNVTVQQLQDALTLNDYYAAQARYTDMVGGTVSLNLLISAITAVLISLILMLGYIFLRFEFASAISAIAALLHDVVMMFLFMIIFRIEFNATFIAALITILGYSINNTIIIFDRVRENVGILSNKNISAAEITNKSVNETLSRTINTTLTTLIMIVMITIVSAIGGITDLISFTLPIIFGLLSGTFSSICIAPSIWSLMKKNNIKTPAKKTVKKEREAVATNQE